MALRKLKFFLEISGPFPGEYGMQSRYNAAAIYQDERSGTAEELGGQRDNRLGKGASKNYTVGCFSAVEGDKDDFFSFHPNISQTCKVGRSYEKVLGGHLDDVMLAMRGSLERVTLKQLINGMPGLYQENSQTEWNIHSCSAYQGGDSPYGKFPFRTKNLFASVHTGLLFR